MTTTTSARTTPAHTERAPVPAPAVERADDGDADPQDAREQIEVAVMMANGRLAPRRFTSRADAEAWAQDDEQVVEFNLVCACDM